LILCNHQQEILFEQRPPIGLWGGLWSFPEVCYEEDALAWGQHHYGSAMRIIDTLPVFRHTFSHFHLDITPLLMKPKSKLLSIF
ncbi:NUDIX domain-containing protein, partial [Acinetobacter baumannii]